MAESLNAAKYQGTLKLIPFISPSNDHETRSICSKTSDSSIHTGLSGEEVSQFYDSVVSTPSNQELKKPSTRKSIKCKKPPPITNVVKLSPDSILRFSQEGNIKQIEKCVSVGHSVDQQDSYGWTPLMCATCEGHTDAVAYLLKQGANPNIKCKSGMRPLDIALKANNNIIVRLLQSGVSSDETASCSTVEQSSEEKYCDSCKVYYKVSTNTHERSIAHLFNTKKTKLSTFYHIPENNKGFQIMLKKGWDKNKGLGPTNAEGRKFPIKTVLKKDRACIGKHKEVAKVTHFSANDKAAVKSQKPLTYRTVREKTLKKWQRKKMEEVSRQKEINFRRQFNCDF
ncbi:hypothetical protein JTE90_013318 [Oedothorax gibbosus]|uniref:G-patch domain-containing protein n=1 Tax=Oedothorax gibbosus TaxID=931172 RepID=A0AAV6VCT1_9ARAC|nr:hypothetical protein JTE90_013318 [Oedothorax gibbosus]